MLENTVLWYSVGNIETCAAQKLFNGLNRIDTAVVVSRRWMCAFAAGLAVTLPYFL